jgi:hypothetical protein
MPTSSGRHTYFTEAATSSVFIGDQRVATWVYEKHGHGRVAVAAIGVHGRRWLRTPRGDFYQVTVEQMLAAFPDLTEPT